MNKEEGKKPLVVGISGIARAGKDSFVQDCFTYLDKYNQENNTNIYFNSVSFAQAIKEALNYFLLRHYKISPWTEDEKEKKLIRPFLLAHGDGMREIGPLHWVNKLKEQIERNQTFAPGRTEIFFVSDVRRAEVEFDEVSLIKDYFKGSLVYVERRDEYNCPLESLIPHEIKNDPTLREKANFIHVNHQKGSPAADVMNRRSHELIMLKIIEKLKLKEND